MRNHFLGRCPAIEAARIDGARWHRRCGGTWIVAHHTPSGVTVVNEWNEYLWSFLMSDDELRHHCR